MDEEILHRAATEKFSIFRGGQFAETDTLVQCIATKLANEPEYMSIKVLCPTLHRADLITAKVGEALTKMGLRFLMLSTSVCKTGCIKNAVHVDVADAKWCRGITSENIWIDGFSHLRDVDFVRCCVLPVLALVNTRVVCLSDHDEGELPIWAELDKQFNSNGEPHQAAQNAGDDLSQP